MPFGSHKCAVSIEFALSNTYVSCMRASCTISKNWKERIEEDFKKRGVGK